MDIMDYTDKKPMAIAAPQFLQTSFFCLPVNGVKAWIAIDLTEWCCKQLFSCWWNIFHADFWELPNVMEILN